MPPSIDDLAAAFVGMYVQLTPAEQRLAQAVARRMTDSGFGAVTTGAPT